MEDVSEPDTTTFKCLFCEQEFQVVGKMFGHVETEHGFPIGEKIRDVGSSTTFALPPHRILTNNPNRF
jgi:protein arginine N-methyltransferase 3